MLTLFMSIQVRVKFWLGFNLGEGKHHVELTHGHDFVLCNIFIR